MTAAAETIRDARRNRRYALRAPVLFTWPDGRHYGGFTRDISCTGIFVETPDPPPPGAEVCVHLVLPGLTEKAESIRMEASCKVVRSSRTHKEKVGFAGASARLIVLHRSIRSAFESDQRAAGAHVSEGR